jgi:hypothetical protein
MFSSYRKLDDELFLNTSNLTEVMNMPSKGIILIISIPRDKSKKKKTVLWQWEK